MKKLTYLIALLFATILFNSCKKENPKNILDNVPSLEKTELITSRDTLFFYGTSTQYLIVSTTSKRNKSYGFVIDNLPWLNAIKYNGYFENNMDTLELFADLNSMPPGIYEGSCEIISDFAIKKVYIKGLSGYLIPDSLNISFLENNKVIPVANLKNYPVNYSISFSNNYLSAATTGNIGTNQIGNINFTVNRNGLKTGIYTTLIYLTIENQTDTIVANIECFVPEKVSLQNNLIDAEYSKATNQLLYVTSNPSQLHIYNTLTKTSSSINLSFIPTCVAVSADGSNAVVGHDGKFSYVNLSTSSVTQVFNVDCPIFDIAIGLNNWAYIIPQPSTFFSIRCVDLSLNTNNQTLHTGRFISSSSNIKIHPSGRFVYTSSTQVFPSDIQKLNIQNGTAAFLYDSPYHGEYEPLSNFWFSEDGTQIFTNGKAILSSAEKQEDDLRYQGKIELEPNSHRIYGLAHSSTKNNLYVISTAKTFPSEHNLPNLYVFNATNYALKNKLSLEKYLVGNTLYEAEPKFVFCNLNGSEVYVITKSTNTGTTNSWGLEKIKIN